jgi:hypothetical protein
LVVQFRDMLSGYSTVGLKDIKTENPIFDEKFVIRGNERDFAINLINSEIQNKFLQLGNEYYYPMMKITKDKFSLACSNFSTELYESTDYDKLIDFAIVILDNLRKLCVIQIPGLDF